MKIVGIIIVVFIVIVYLAFVIEFGGFAYLGLLLGSFAVVLFSMTVSNLIKNRSLDKVKISSTQKKELESARAHDEEAKKENAKTRTLIEKQWEQDRQKRAKEIDLEIKELEKEYTKNRNNLDKEMKNLDSMNSLSEEDKSLETIEYLIYFIKTHRADSIKEALHEYDKLQTNKQMLEIERQKLEANLKKAALEHEDRMKQLEAEKMHNYEMECLSRDNARSRQEIAKNLDFISYQIHYK